MITIQEFSIVVVMFCTVTTLFLSILSFRRNRRLDNENTLFKLKVEGYFGICDKFNEMADLLNESNELMEHGANNVDEILAIAEDFYKKTQELFSYAMRYGIVFPENILDDLGKLHTKSIPIQKHFDEPERMENLLALQEEHYDSFFEQMDELYASMREDIGSDKLNKTLSKRIR